MKKIAMIAAGLLSLGYLGAEKKSTFNLDTNIGFSTERVYRGRKQGRKIFSPSVKLSIPFFGKGKIYTGCEAFLGVEGKSIFFKPLTRNEVNSYLGISYDITDTFTLDAGHIHHSYVNDPKNMDAKSIFRAAGLAGYTPAGMARMAQLGGMSQNTVTRLRNMPQVNEREIDLALNGEELPFPFKKESNEIYFGVMADVLLSPSLYFFYNFDHQEAAVEGQISYTYDLSQFGLNKAAIELGAKFGYDNAKKVFGIKNKNMALCHFRNPNAKTDYIYYGAKANLVYNFNEHAKAQVGVEFAGNNAKKKTPINMHSGYKHNNFVWFNASVDCSI